MKKGIPMVCDGAGGVCGKPAARWFEMLSRDGKRTSARCRKHAAAMTLEVVANWVNKGYPIVEKTLDELIIEEVQNS